MRTLTDIALEQERLEKSFKYIRREWRNGRWRYWYEEPRVKVASEGKYGKITRRFTGDPRQAFKQLFHDKTGQAFDVVTVNLPAIDIGQDGKFYEVKQSDGDSMLVDTPVDLIWGNKGKGLKHILLRHYVQQNDFNSIKEVEDTLTYNLIKLQNLPNSFNIKFIPDKQCYELKDWRGQLFVVGVELDNDIDGNKVVRHFILTDYDVSEGRNRKQITNTKIKAQRNSKINQTRY